VRRVKQNPLHFTYYMITLLHQAAKTKHPNNTNSFIYSCRRGTVQSGREIFVPRSGGMLDVGE
jgi:hypothetical protein